MARTTITSLARNACCILMKLSRFPAPAPHLCSPKSVPFFVPSSPKQPRTGTVSVPLFLVPQQPEIGSLFHGFFFKQPKMGTMSVPLNEYCFGALLSRSPTPQQ